MGHCPNLGRVGFELPFLLHKTDRGHMKLTLLSFDIESVLQQSNRHVLQVSEKISKYLDKNPLEVMILGGDRGKNRFG